MTIAEFFVNLGVKGENAAGKALGGVKSGLGEVKSMSLEAKAAIVGAIYALERMMSSSAKTGTGLLDFATSTGISAKTLQQWQHGMRTVGGTVEEVEASMRSVQSTMAKTLMGQGRPSGLARVAELTGGITRNDLEDTMKMMEKLREYALKETNISRGNEVMKSFGLSDGMIAAMRRNAFDPKTLAQAQVYSDGQVKALNKVDAAWAQFNNRVKMGFGTFFAEHGPKIVAEISKIADEFFKMLNAFEKMAERLQLFELISMIFEGWGIIFNGIRDIVAKMFPEEEGKGKKKKPLKDKFSDWIMEKYDDYQFVNHPNQYAGPKLQPIQQNPAKHPVETVINQTLNFQHDGKDASKTAESVGKAADKAIRVSPALSGGI